MRSSLLMGLAALCLAHSGAQGAALRVAPTSLALIAPDSAATLNLRNEDTRPVNVQIRVFRWSQAEGVERLEPTTEVAVSPPITTLAPKSDYIVRVVRVAKTPVSGEESYRLLVDELPDPTQRRPGTVNFVLRYSIPVFFTNPDTSPPNVSWVLNPRDDVMVLTARNSGARHLRIVDLQLADSGKTIARQSGLVGYVLGASTASWLLPRGNGTIAGDSVVLSAQSVSGPTNAVVPVQTGP
jgi:fimbrial chaperone protein